MFGRILVSIIAVPFLIYIVLRGDISLFFLTAGVIGTAVYEFYKMLENKKVKAYKKTGMAAAVLIPLLYYILTVYKKPSDGIVTMITVLTVLYLMTRHVLFGEIKEAMVKIGFTIFGVLYISMLFTHVLHLRYITDKSIVLNFMGLFSINAEEGRLWIFTTFLMVWASDTAAYFIGSNFGKHKLIPRVSPKKSVEGAVAGFLAPVIIMLIAKLMYFKDLSIIHCIMMGILAGIFGQIGDLAESLLKRECEVKDSGKILLGHGGALDRFDSLLFVIPLIYYYAKIFVY